MKNLTQGRIQGHLFAMWWMMLLNMSTGALFSLVNLYWLGRLGPAAQAAVSLAAIPVMFALLVMPVISVGAQVLISHAVGAGDRDRANRIFNQAIGASAMVMVLLGPMLWWGRTWFGDQLTRDADTVAMVSDYLRWFIPSAMIQIPMMVFAGSLEATGNVRAGTLAQIGSVVLNSVLSPLLMFGWLGLPRLGVEGVGIGSFAACVLTTAAMTLYSARQGSYLTLAPASWLKGMPDMRSLLKIGVPSALGGAVMAVLMGVVALLLRRFGATEQAAFGIGWRVMQTAIMPLMALSSATSVIVGQNFGARLPERVHAARRISLIASIAMGCALLMLIEAFTPSIIGVFSDHATAVGDATDYLRIVAFSLVPLSLCYTVFGVLSAQGNTAASLKASTAYAVCVVVPAIAFSHFPQFSPNWLWRIMLFASCAQALIAWSLLRAEQTAPVLARPDAEAANASSIA